MYRYYAQQAKAGIKAFARKPREWTDSLCGIIKTQRNLLKNEKLPHRRLEIGPGRQRIPGFETLNIVNGPQVDYVWDTTIPLPFHDGSFELVFASHILEHLPWFVAEDVLRDWVRVLSPKGHLEVWVPDGLLICQMIVDHSLGVENNAYLDGWLLASIRNDPYRWASGRLFFGLRPDYPSWHKAIFTAESLRRFFSSVGLQEVRQMNNAEFRGNCDHGVINLGMVGTKV